MNEKGPWIRVSSHIASFIALQLGGLGVLYGAVALLIDGELRLAVALIVAGIYGSVVSLKLSNVKQLFIALQPLPWILFVILGIPLLVIFAPVTNLLSLVLFLFAKDELRYPYFLSPKLEADSQKVEKTTEQERDRLVSGGFSQIAAMRYEMFIGSRKIELIQGILANQERDVYLCLAIRILKLSASIRIRSWLRVVLLLNARITNW